MQTSYKGFEIGDCKTSGDDDNNGEEESALSSEKLLFRFERIAHPLDRAGIF